MSWSKELKSREPGAADQARQALRQWQQAPDLANLRDKAALTRLPEAERKQWQQLWADLAELLRQSEPRK